MSMDNLRVYLFEYFGLDVYMMSSALGPGDDLIVTMSILEYMSVELDSNGTHKYPFILI